MNDTSAMFQQHSADVPRDQWGRYLLPGEDGDNVGWTRATTFAATLAESHGLRIYEQRQVALGMGRRPDLATLASTIAGPEDKKALGAIVDSAHEAAGTQAKANRGTAVHAAIQAVEQAPDFTVAIAAVPNELRRDVISYFNAVSAANLQILPNLVERVVIVPQYRVAGTPDNYVLCPDGKIRVLDKKTGNLDYASIEFAVQLSMYANAKALRNYGTNSYEPLPEIATDYAIIAHVVNGNTELMRVNIAWGWAWARTCAEVMDIRKTKNVITPYVAGGSMQAAADVVAPQRVAAQGTVDAAAIGWSEGAGRDFGAPSREDIAQSLANAGAVVQHQGVTYGEITPGGDVFVDGVDTSDLFYIEMEQYEDEDPSPGAQVVTAPAPQEPAPVASVAEHAPAAAVSVPTTPAAGAAGSEPPLIIDDPEAAAQALVDGAKGKAKLQQAAKDFSAHIMQRTGGNVEFKLNQHQIKLARDIVAAAVRFGVELPAFAPSSRSRADTPETEDEKRLTVQLDQIRRMPTVEGLTQYQAQLGDRWTDDHQQVARVRVEEIHAQTEKQQTGLTVEQIIDGATSTQTLTLAWRKATNNNTDPAAWTPALQQRSDAKMLELTGNIAGQTAPQQA